MRPAVFLDKDGTLIENVPYNVDPAKIRLASGAASALADFGRAGLPVIVITNQPGIARGKFGIPALKPIEAKLRSLLRENGSGLEGFYYCPHDLDDRCSCRKPKTGMLRQAAIDHAIDLKESWMIGDTLDDIEAGRSAGCRTILIDNGGETIWESGPGREPHFTVKDLAEAARIVLNPEGTLR